MPYLQSIRSSITIDRTILEGSQFLARGPCRPRVYVGFETCKCVGGEVKDRDTHISSFMRRVYYHSRGRTFALRLPVDGSIVTRWNHASSHVGLPTELQDIRLLLYQRSKAEEFFVNHNDWHMNFLPTHEPIIVPELAYDSEYMPWFRIYGNPYFYGEEALTKNPLVIPSVYETLHSYAHLPFVIQTPLGSLFY
ncbi:hypothetical protein Goari_024350 [Gossypium aridum]|uniref:Uncharacterized protein n=1 Tax=Gossypium aridum TaxID=34290 RepID=A0A7J8X781_GOSAI|nr:hypothetical protein [Gossypium aridum]